MRCVFSGFIVSCLTALSAQVSANLIRYQAWRGVLRAAWRAVPRSRERESRDLDAAAATIVTSVVFRRLLLRLKLSYYHMT